MKTHIDDIFRLYIREWVIVHTLYAKGGEGNDTLLTEHAEAWIKQHLADRVPDKHIRLDLRADDDQLYWCHIEVFKDNQKGEFKQLGAAETYAHIHQYEEYTIVARNSAADHEIRSYGVVKL